MVYDKIWIKARRLSGLAAFERNPRMRITSECGRMKLAYKVPGTPEAGKWHTLNEACAAIAKKLRAAAASASTQE